LLENGASINFPDCAGWTPLHVAVQSERPYICYLLLKNGASLTMQNMRKETPADLTTNRIILRAMQVVPKGNGGQELTKDFLEELEKEEIERDNYLALDKKSCQKRMSMTATHKKVKIEQERKSLKKPALQRSNVHKYSVVKDSDNTVQAGMKIHSHKNI